MDLYTKRRNRMSCYSGHFFVDEGGQAKVILPFERQKGVWCNGDIASRILNFDLRRK